MRNRGPTHERRQRLSIILEDDHRHLTYFVVLREIGTRLRAAIPHFELGHLALLADELDVDLSDASLLDPSPADRELLLAQVFKLGFVQAARWADERLIPCAVVDDDRDLQSWPADGPLESAHSAVD